MSNVSNLGNFPHTIGNLDDRPNLTAAQMKAKLEQDVMVLWAKLVEAIPYINDILPVSRLVDIVNSSSTDNGVPTAKAVYDAIADASLGGNAQQIIDDWLDAHPEATTTVTDGSITNAKLASTFVTPGVASAYVSGTEYPAGSYVFHGGTLYTNPEDVSDGVWTSAHWVSVALGNDVTDLKSAFDELIDDAFEIVCTSKNIFNEDWDKQGYTISNSGPDAGELTPSAGYQATSWYLPFYEGEGGLYYIQTSVAPACSVHCYDSNKQYLGSKAFGNNLSGGVTVYEGTAFLRFSTYIVSGWHVAICGATSGAFTEYVPYTFEYTVIGMDDIKPIYYQIDTFAAGGEECFVVSHYGDDKDFCLRFWKRIRGNEFFDISQLSVILNQSKIVSKAVGNRTAFNTNETEWHSPFKVTADNNATGDCADDNKFTGGSHDYTNGEYTGSATMRVISIKYFADGKEVANGDSGYCDHFEVHWTNMVQGSNTEKSDGTGREILQENHRMVFNGVWWDDYVELIALEDIHITIWYGFQLVGLKSGYGNFRYIGDSNRGLYTNSASHNSGGYTCDKIIAYGDANRCEVNLDRTFDLGRNYRGEYGAFNIANANKCYFSVINEDAPGFAIAQGEMYCARARYRFMPGN